jgi:hypothetical protein
VRLISPIFLQEIPFYVNCLSSVTPKYDFINYIDHSLSWTSNSRPNVQEIVCLLWYPKLFIITDTTLTHLNIVYVVTSYFKIRFNTGLPSTPVPPNGPLFFRLLFIISVGVAYIWVVIRSAIFSCNSSQRREQCVESDMCVEMVYNLSFKLLEGTR